MKYLWVAIAAGISIGAAVSREVNLCFEVWTPFVCGVVMGILVLLKSIKYKCVFLLLFALIYGASSVSLDKVHFDQVAWRMPGKVIVLSGTVKTFPEKAYSQYKWEFQCEQFRMEEGPWHRTKSQVEVSIPATENPPLVGDYLIIKGKIRFPRQDEAGAKWMVRNYFVRDIAAQIRVRKFGDVIPDGWNGWYFPLRVLQLVRESLILKIEKVYSPKQSQIMKALLVGLKMTDSEIRNMFVRSSTSHLLSVSGFHTAVVAGIIFSFLILLRSPPSVAVFVSSLGVLAYVALTGWGVAVQRSGLMAILVWSAWSLGRPQKLIYWLNLALAGILWMEPKQIWSISFQLSFLSMYGIILLAPVIKRFLPLPGLDVSVAAFLATYPAVLFHFQNFAWAGIFANLIAVPAFALILPAGFFSLIPWVGSIAVIPVKLLLAGTMWVLERIAEQPWSCLILPQPHIEWIFVYYFFGGLVLWLSRRPNVSASASAV